MGTSGSPPDASRTEVWKVFVELAEPHTPLTTNEVVSRLDASVSAVEDDLEALVDHGELQSKEIGAQGRVWWRSGEKDTGPVDEPNHEEFGAFVDAVEDYAIFKLDPDGTVASWNEGAKEIKGYTAEEIVGEHFSTFYTDDDVTAGVPEQHLAKAASEGRIDDDRWRLRADGSRFFAHVVTTAIRDDNGELQGYTKVTRDMTDQWEAEQQLRRERNLVEQVLETVPVSIYTIDADGTFVRANQRALERIDGEGDDISEYDVDSWEIYDADGDPIPMAEWPWMRAMETGEPVTDFQCQSELPGLGRRWLSINVAPITDGTREEGRAVAAVEDITDQKEREHQLRRERDQTEQLLRTAPISIAVTDDQGDPILANQRAQDVLGLTEQEFIDEPDDADEWSIYDDSGEPLPPDETPSARVLAAGQPVENEEIIIETADGDRLRIRLSAAPLFDSDGAVERVVLAGEDVTELRERERELRQRKSELETELGEILERISDAFYAVDGEWRFTLVNQRAMELFGRSRDELLGNEIWEVFPGQTDSVYRENLEAAMQTQEPGSFEVYEAAIDTWLEFSVYPSETGLSVYFRDVTQRVEYELELEQYKTIVETVSDGVYVVNDDGRFTIVNQTYADMTGYDRDELIGEHVSKVVSDDVHQRAQEVEASMLEGDAEDPGFEADIETRSGERLTAEATFAMLPSGHDHDRVGVVRDITERREAQRKLEESNERLEQFAYAASHDLQEPLRMVTSYLQLIENRYGDDLDDDGHEFLEFAVDGADRMRDMIEGLLQYSRVDTQGDSFDPVDLDEVLANVRTDLQMRIEETDTTIDSADLPVVEGDDDQLRLVFQNLLDNAIEYSGDGPPQIYIDAKRLDDRWAIAVSDEGIGIHPDDTDRVFEVFQRLHAPGEHAGTGIGLALVERIVERHGGDIWIESDPGEGATFTFTLPAQDA